MLFGGGLLAIAIFAFWVYCILDVIATDESLMRNMPKVLWLIVVIILPTVGSVAWLVLGRPQNASFVPGESAARPLPRREKSRPLGPEDSPEFITELDDRAARLRKWEEDLKRREDDIRRREDGEPPPDQPPSPN